MKIEKFEDIKAWQEARVLVDEVYRICNKSSFENDFYLLDQMKRASISIMSNIVEGFDRKSDKDFARFLFISIGSASELQSHLYIALDRNYIDQKIFDVLYSRTTEIKKMIFGFIRYLNKPYNSTSD